MPAGDVEYEHDAAFAACAGLAGEGGERLGEDGFERPVERYRTASPLVGCTKAVTCSHWWR
jgi:hypothetical protein